VADRTPVIVGVGLSDYPRAPDLDSVQHHVLAMQRALEDCGLTTADIDGYLCAGGSSLPMVDSAEVMAEYLGIAYRYVDGTAVGGSSFEYHVQHAAAALRDGLCETVLITYGSDQLSRMGRTLGSKAFYDPDSRVPGPPQYEVPYGNTLIGAYAMAARRHMHEYGTTSEQLAEIAVATRQHAQHNPQAQLRDAIEVEDVLGSRMVADPLHKLDCCVISDGGGAIVMTTAERARDLSSQPVFVLGAACAQTHWNISQMPDFTTSAAARCGPEALAQAGITSADVDAVQLYDSFTITALILLEDLGFCAKGEGGAFVAGTSLGPGGKLPLNTDGGGLSACHPGMRGIFLLAEGVRQLRGQAGTSQVPDCRHVLACGSGAWLSAIGTVILGRDRP
jgi:acetyl-CoA acetyltransferase